MQSTNLSLISTGNKYAIASKGFLALEEEGGYLWFLMILTTHSFIPLSIHPSMQSTNLSLISTGNKYAIASKGILALEEGYL